MNLLEPPAPGGPPRLVLIGAGGLGCAAAMVLARSPRPVEIVVVDADAVEASNLHRQVLHESASLGQPKAASLCRAIEALARADGHTGTRAVAVAARLDRSNARSLVRGAAVVLDGSDNFPTRFRAADACLIEGVPLVHAAAIRWQGQLLVVDSHARPGSDEAARGPCLRCLFEAPPPPGPGLRCDEAGVCGPVVGVVGALAAEAALELLDDARGRGRAVAIGRLVTFDGLAGTFRTVHFRRRPGCAGCGAGLADLFPDEDYEVPAC